MRHFYRAQKKWWEIACPTCSYFYSGPIAVEMGTEGLAACESQFGAKSVETALTLMGLATIYGRMGECAKQVELLRRALAIYGKEDRPQEKVSALSCLGNAYSKMENPEGALEALKSCMALDGDDALLLADIGRVYGELGDGEQSRQHLEKAIPLLQQQLGASHRLVADANVNLGVAYGLLGQMQKHRQLIEDALQILQRALGPEHRGVARALQQLGLAYGAEGDVDKQRDLLERALAIKEREFGKSSLQLAALLADLAAAYERLPGEEPERLRKQALERGLEIAELELDPDHRLLARFHKAMKLVVV